MPIRIYLVDQSLWTLIGAPERRVAQEKQLLSREIETGK